MIIGQTDKCSEGHKDFKTQTEGRIRTKHTDTIPMYGGNEKENFIVVDHVPIIYVLRFESKWSYLIYLDIRNPYVFLPSQSS